MLSFSDSSYISGEVSCISLCLLLTVELCLLQACLTTVEPPFCRRIFERPLTYDEIIEGVPRVAFPEELEVQFEIPLGERFF